MMPHSMSHSGRISRGSKNIVSNDHRINDHRMNDRRTSDHRTSRRSTYQYIPQNHERKGSKTGYSSPLSPSQSHISHQMPNHSMSHQQHQHQQQTQLKPGQANTMPKRRKIMRH